MRHYMLHKEFGCRLTPFLPITSTRTRMVGKEEMVFPFYQDIHEDRLQKTTASVRRVILVHA